MTPADNQQEIIFFFHFMDRFEFLIKQNEKYESAGLTRDEAGDLVNIEAAMLNGATLSPSEEERMRKLRDKMKNLLHQKK